MNANVNNHPGRNGSFPNQVDFDEKVRLKGKDAGALSAIHSGIKQKNVDGNLQGRFQVKIDKDAVQLALAKLSLSGVAAAITISETDAANTSQPEKPIPDKSLLPPTPPASAAASRSQAAVTNSKMEAISLVKVEADLYSFMGLFLKIAQETRDTSRLQRTTQMQIQSKALQNAANEMRSSAQARFTAAMWQGSFQVAGGIASMGFAKSQFNSSKKAMAAGETTTGFHTMNANQAGNRAQAMGSLFGGIGGMIGASYTRKGDLMDAKRAEFEAQAKVAESASQTLGEFMQQMMEVIRDIRDKLQSITQSAIETNRGIARHV